MNVNVERQAAPNPSRSEGKRVVEQEPARALKAVWIIMQTDYAHHTDEEGRSDVTSSTAYESVHDANEAARYVLFDACGVEDEDELSGIELTENNRDSATKGYVGIATVYEDDRHEVKVEVRKLDVQHGAVKIKRRSASSSDQKSNKKRKVEAEDVIDISND